MLFNRWRAALALIVVATAIAFGGSSTGAAASPVSHAHFWAGWPVHVEPLPQELWLPGTGSAYRLRYTTTGHDEWPAVVSGAVFMPAGTPPPGGWPVTSWAHGTVGVADVCAPSTAGRSQRDIDYLSAWLGVGYAIVATDYEGLGTPGPHPYLDGESEAYATIDVFRAARRIDKRLAKRWMAVGQSQGAQAAMFVAALVDDYAPSTDFRGTIATGLPSQWRTTFEAAAPFVPTAPANPLVIDTPLGRMLSDGALGSVIFWGPPGVGKTTIARSARRCHRSHHFVQISASFTGVADLRKIFDSRAVAPRQRPGDAVVHRRDPPVQQGAAGCVPPLCRTRRRHPDRRHHGESVVRSDCRTALAVAGLRLTQLDECQRRSLCSPALCRFWNSRPRLNCWNRLRSMPTGMRARRTTRWKLLPLRQAENSRETAVQDAMQRKVLLYDKGGEEHFNLISALHKSVRSSEVDAALYWLTRMIEAGEDRLYIARRLIRMALEDIGLADPQAQRLCLDAWATYERLGSPEGELALAQAVVYLVLAAKSNAVYRA